MRRRPIATVETAALVLVRIYRRAISPHFPPACRFSPTCSEYAEESIRRHGVRRGISLSLRRVLRCRPFGSSGYDPVP